jgi:hypothetical protein
MDEQPNPEELSEADHTSGCRAEDGAPRIMGTACDADSRVTTYTYSYDPEPPLYEFERQEEKGVFAVTGPDGKTDYFRDRPTRYLVVEPDPETGEFAPAVKRRRPVFLWLCREEREGDVPTRAQDPRRTGKSNLGCNDGHATQNRSRG